VNDVSAHLLFVLVCAVAIAFLMWMRHRLRTQYPDDDSRQMQSMLGFMRGMAIFAAVVLAIVLGDLVRVLVAT
jgi:uncharacterized membrane protein required for colicin V production